MKVNKAKLKFIVSVSLILLASSGLGFMAGYYEGTGVFPTLYPAESIAPPADLATVTADETEQTLSVLKDKEYGDGYNCVDYAWEAMRLLRWQGQSSVIVGLGIDAEPGPDHAILLVPTKDKGWIFVEPQTGVEAIGVVVGGKYVGKLIRSVEVLVVSWISYEDYLNDIAGNITEANNG